MGNEKMETRGNKKSSTPLSEEELIILREQLTRKQEQLVEQEAAFKRESQERYLALQKRETEFMDREHEQAQRFPNNQGAATSATASSPPGNYDDIVATLLQEFKQLKQEITNLQSERTQTSPPPSEAPYYPPRAQHTPHPQLSYRDALESIPTYDGENMTVLKFTRACNRVKEMFPPVHEPSLTRLLRNKLSGKAYTAVEDDIFLSITEFCARLKSIFGTAKTVNQYRGELGNIAKNKSEHIIDYISRVKDLHSVILEGEKFGVNDVRIQNLEQETLTCFLSGLPPDFRIRLKLEGFADLHNAYSVAIRVEKEMDYDRSRFKTETKTVAAVDTTTTSTSTAQPCPHCNRKGHVEETCWTKHPNLRPERKELPKTEGAVCTYCNRPGHTEQQCFKKQKDAKESGNERDRPSNQGTKRTEKQADRPVKTVQTDEDSQSEQSEPSTSC